MSTRDLMPEISNNIGDTRNDSVERDTIIETFMNTGALSLIGTF